MQLKTSDVIEIPVERIETAVDINQIENFSHFSAVRLAKKHYEKKGFAVLEGENFENNLMLYFYGQERLFYDEYIKVKLGKARITTDAAEYSEAILSAIPSETVKMLMQLCRFCSYAGDPGFPDLIMLNDKPREAHLKYVLFDELSASQKMFLLLSKLLGIDIGIVKISPLDKGSVNIKLGGLLDLVLDERRARNIMEGLGGNIQEAEGKAGSVSGIQAAIFSDELAYLLNEKAKNPLFLFSKWKERGIVSSLDLIGLIDFTLANSKNNFGIYLENLETDSTFALMKEKTEDAMRQKAEYMQKKFGIGPTRSKLLLNFF